MKNKNENHMHKNHRNYDDSCNKAKKRIAKYEPLDFETEYPDEDTISEVLGYYSDNIRDMGLPAMVKNGFYNTEDRLIGACGDPFYGAFIPSVALIHGKLNNSMIINTQNNGPRFAGITDDGETVDIGAVTVPCVIGTVKKPYGMYVPFGNPKAIKDSITRLSTYYNTAMEQAFGDAECPDNMRISITDETDEEE